MSKCEMIFKRNLTLGLPELRRHSTYLTTGEQSTLPTDTW